MQIVGTLDPRIDRTKLDAAAKEIGVHEDTVVTIVMTTDWPNSHILGSTKPAGLPDEGTMADMQSWDRSRGYEVAIRPGIHATHSLLHELTHVYQAQDHPLEYSIMYSLEGMLFGYSGIEFEEQAEQEAKKLLHKYKGLVTA